jgi:hypothetical protein
MAICANALGRHCLEGWTRLVVFQLGGKVSGCWIDNSVSILSRSSAFIEISLITLICERLNLCLFSSIHNSFRTCGDEGRNTGLTAVGIKMSLTFRAHRIFVAEAFFVSSIQVERVSL